jgi:photosystem II stability/assembly factor-like uncharacterized protein
MKKTLTILLFISPVVSNAQWSKLTSGTTENLNSVSFSDTINGWVVGNNNAVLQTLDGGKNFYSNTAGTLDANYYSVCATSSVDINIVGSDSFVHNTEYEGTFWNQQSLPVVDTLYGVMFRDKYNGYACGTNGKILHKGGTNWDEKNSGTTATLHSIYHKNPLYAWAVGNNGTIVHTINSGATWNPQTSGTLADLKSVFFITDDSGWAVGNNGTIIFTADGGDHWNMQNSGTTNTLNGVCFIDLQRGWIVGNNGTILTTQNGGTSWASEKSSTSYNLNSCSFTAGDSVGWAVGDNGIIIKRDGKIHNSTVPNQQSNVVIKMYPNPTQHFITIQSNNITIPQDCPYAMYNSLGEVVIQERLQNTHTIDLSSLSAGNYILELKTTTLKYRTVISITK